MIRQPPKMSKSARLDKLHRDRTGVTKGIVWREDGWPVMQSVLKPGEKGTAAVTHFTISQKAADHFNWSLAFTAGTAMQRVAPGKYVRLHVGGRLADDVMMSDTRHERNTCTDIRNAAHGRVLIAGLGIGMILHPILDPNRANRRHAAEQVGACSAPAVEHVTVVEMNQDVIDLVAPSLARYGDRLTIIKSDINNFGPDKGTKYDTVYFDIWPTLSDDNLPEIAKLHQRWKSRLNRASEQQPWMSSWCVDYLRSQRRDNSRW